MNEQTPLVISRQHGSIGEDPEAGRTSSRQFHYRAIAITFGATIVYLVCALVFNGDINSLPFSEALGGIIAQGNGKDGLSSMQGAASMAFRPLCEIHTKKHRASIIQTSLSEPSRQWNPITCNPVTDYTGIWPFRKQLPFLNKYAVPDAIIQVDTENTGGPINPDRSEPILGFGGAFSEATALNFNSLSEKAQDAVLGLLFGESGLGYSLGRVHVGSCDFCVDSYSFDETDGDFKLKDFDTSVMHDQNTGMIDMMQKAEKVLKDQWGDDNKSAGSEGNDVMKDGKLNIFVSPWSPPAWMKAPTPKDIKNSNGTAVHASDMIGSAPDTCLRDGVGPNSKYAASYALYLSKFISAYKNLGVNVVGMTVQNEAEFAAPWEGCVYNEKTQSEFIINHLGPTLREDHPDVKLLVYDHNKDHVNIWGDYMLDETNAAAEYIDGVALHWYTSGLDRLLDGSTGSPNVHDYITHIKKMNVKSDNLILGAEACHCPSTGYAGGDINVAWSRAEQYAHGILADLAVGYNGWIEWNMVLDSIGGPNHIGNMCDAPILAVPKRAAGSNSVPGPMGHKLPSFEHHDHPFGPVIGDGRTSEELNAMGFPAEYLDMGVVVQPLYYFMGHISRYVRPGSRAIRCIVSESESDDELDSVSMKARAFRPEGRGFAGGGINGLAHPGIEVTLWPCEGSTRQLFKLNEEGQIQVNGHDWQGTATTSCVGKKNDKVYGGLVLGSCDIIENSAGVFDAKPVRSIGEGGGNIDVRFVLRNGKKKKKDTASTADSDQECLQIKYYGDGGGAYGTRGGARASIGSCEHASSVFKFDKSTRSGEISADASADNAGELCLTTGWPFLQAGAFDTPNGKSKNAIVVLNEAAESANYAVRDDTGVVILTTSIPAHSIQTIALD